MKPIVIYCKEKELKLTIEEFEKYLDEAYAAGRKDGYNEGYASGKAFTWYPTNTPTITTPHITWEKQTPYDPYKITYSNVQSTSLTGEAHNAVGD